MRKKRCKTESYGCGSGLVTAFFHNHVDGLDTEWYIWEESGRKGKIYGERTIGSFSSAGCAGKECFRNCWSGCFAVFSCGRWEFCCQWPVQAVNMADFFYIKGF